MEIPLLSDIAKIFGLSIVVLLVCARLRIPAVVGLLLTGVLCGPHGLRMVKELHEVEMMSEIGIVLLLFTIGLEFSLAKLVRIKKLVLIGGFFQVFLTVVVIAAAASLAGYHPGSSIFFGFLVALSSTAIVLRIMQERAQLGTPHGQSILAIMIFQDIAVVPMMLMAPFLAGTETIDPILVFLHLGKGILILLSVFLLAQWGVPHLLYQIARTRNNQLFILCVLFICISVAWVTSSIGLSLALGAFLAGLIIAESEYASHAVGHILPFQQVFTSFFFVSIGMLFDAGFLMQHPFTTLFVTVLVIAVKLLVAGGVISAMGYPLRNALLTGIGLAQVGEFAFILSTNGIAYGLMSPDDYQLFLAVSLVTMALTPLMIAMGPEIVNKVTALKLPERLKLGKGRPESPPEERFKNHVVIIGYGVCGRNLAWAARQSGIRYVILDVNPDTVRRERALGEPIFFGDATNEAVLEQVDIHDARAVAIAVNDPVASRRMVEVIRHENPHVYLITRTRYLHELQPIRDLGADDVIAEEFETSIEIFTRVLRKYLVPQGEIDHFTSEVRSNGYQIFRTSLDEKVTLSDLNISLTDMEIASYRLPEGSPLSGITLEQSGIRRDYGLSVLVIRRGSITLSNPLPSTTLQENDIIVMFGDPEQNMKFASMLK
ncbi:MAG: cation:proton antiporter [Chlamydiales bacterium]|nr:cation:proton antiporter [Chlamydiales bacterium]